VSAETRWLLYATTLSGAGLLLLTVAFLLSGREHRRQS
jgi:hypothetical protein